MWLQVLSTASKAFKGPDFINTIADCATASALSQSNRFSLAYGLLAGHLRAAPLASGAGGFGAEYDSSAGSMGFGGKTEGTTSGLKKDPEQFGTSDDSYFSGIICAQAGRRLYVGASLVHGVLQMIRGRFLKNPLSSSLMHMARNRELAQCVPRLMSSYSTRGEGSVRIKGRLS